ncbi:uncharacterized protein BO87DRAFT_2273 [Aspergillus neoniger CBS 115656]|uniref:Uncharacterized protein n=1 Tax=Aspergillus neoniger (strain CBS 115656) TaxID=1448310 RepID=A0A318YXA5_ASPNB|nr:hypothetical protein BO87DRAFT_2273 [Aspergillus neoniger CBS 115656]PYH39571.1 hypothetical protein BO87DRAFT_2273 [Aspergillus neoniger CBS 115656]
MGKWKHCFLNFQGAYMAGCVSGSHFVHIYMTVCWELRLLFTYSTFSFFASMKILALIPCTIHNASI